MKKTAFILAALLLCMSLGGTAMASMSLDSEDLFAPQKWFGDQADDYVLADLHYFDENADANGTGLLLIFSSDPYLGSMMYELYVRRMKENDDLLNTSRVSKDNCFVRDVVDKEACFDYIGSEKVDSVSSTIEPTKCNLFALGWYWNKNTFFILLGWGDGFPMRLDMDRLIEIRENKANTSQPTEMTKPILPDAWTFFRKELSHKDERNGNMVSSKFYFSPRYFENTDAADEYLYLLQTGGFSLELTDSKVQDYGDSSENYYAFTYTGSGEVEPISVSVNGETMNGDVILVIDDQRDISICGVYIYFSDDFYVMTSMQTCGQRDLVDLIMIEFDEPYSTGLMGKQAAQ